MATTAPEPEAASWFAQDETAVLSAFGSDAERGLTQAEATSRLAQYGPNQISGEKPPSVWAIALATSPGLGDPTRSRI